LLICGKVKLEILQEELNKGLAIVSRFVSGRPQLPILANILFSAKDNVLTLSATNLETSIRFFIGAKVEKEGEIAVPAKDISEFISYLSPGKITLTVEKKTQLTVISSLGESNFATQAAGDFPKIPTLDKEKAVSLPKEKLVEAVEKVAFCAADEESRPVLSAIFWQFGEKGCRLVATDGYRLSVKDIAGLKVQMVKKEKTNVFLVPARTFSEVVRLVGDDEKEILVNLLEKSNQMVFGLKNLQLTSRLIEGEFPEYEKIIPAEKKVTVTVGKSEFYQAIKVASVFARQSANVVKIEFNESKGIISANAPSVGENKTEFAAKISGAGIKIAFNYKFLLDFLSACTDKEEEIVIEMNTFETPAVFRYPADSSWFHLIMPIRVEW